ncbi:hypothetical protein M959_07624, partial [Chaetura pelagica]
QDEDCAMFPSQHSLGDLTHFSPAVKTFSQRAKAVPGLCSYPSDIAGKDPAPQIPSTHVGNQGFANREKMLPPAICPSPEQPSIS